MDRHPMRNDQPAPGRQPFQFTLRTMLILMTAAAVVCSGLFTGPDWLSGITLILFVLAVPIVLTVVLLYGRGHGRTFCIGALFPAGLVLCSTLGSAQLLLAMGFNQIQGPGRWPVAIFLAIYCVVIVAAGLLAIAVRRMVEQAARQQRPGAPLRPGPLVDLENVAADTQPGPYWRCVSCGNSVPGNFDACWNCQAPRTPGDEATDPLSDDPRP